MRILRGLIFIPAEIKLKDLSVCLVVLTVLVTGGVPSSIWPVRDTFGLHKAWTDQVERQPAESGGSLRSTTVPWDLFTPSLLTSSFCLQVVNLLNPKLTFGQLTVTVFIFLKILILIYIGYIFS